MSISGVGKVCSYVVQAKSQRPFQNLKFRSTLRDGKDVQPRMKGRSFLIRFADDFIIGFELEEDARRVMDVLPKRFNRFTLNIHPEKTVLVRFKRLPMGNKSSVGNGTFDFLGFASQK